MANEGTEQEIVTRLDLTGMMTEGVISDYNVSLLRNVEDVGSTTVVSEIISTHKFQKFLLFPFYCFATQWSNNHGDIWFVTHV